MSITITIDPLNVSEYSHFEVLNFQGGAIVKWALECPNERNLFDYIYEQYNTPMGLIELPKGGSLDLNNFYCFKCEETGETDPPLPPLIIITRKQETIFIYHYGICAFLSGNDSPKFVRLD